MCRASSNAGNTRGNRRIPVATAKSALATEDQFRDSFPDCEVGAMPPFGNLYGIPVYVDRSLTKDDEIVFEAGNHHEAIKLDYLDFERTVRPKVGEFGES